MYKQRFTGLVQLRLAITLWAKHALKTETDEDRLVAADEYAAAIATGGEHTEAARLRRSVLDTDTRAAKPEYCDTLLSASNLAASLVCLGECTEAVVLLRTALAAQTRTLGVDDEGTLAT